jgi:hypothetical protein
MSIFKGGWFKRTAPENESSKAVLLTKSSLKVTSFQRRFLKRTAPIDELIETALFSQLPLKMSPLNTPSSSSGQSAC